MSDHIPLDSNSISLTTTQGNRFSVLATPPPTKTSSLFREFPTTSARRTRNSRGTKEAKKRRDMRRNRRKLAAQLLDQQLSQAVDETLTKANYPPLPPRPCLFPTPQDAVTALPQPVYFPSVPPELPLPDFSKFDLGAFSHFAIRSTTPPPLRTPTPFRTLPKWCPRIPSLTLGDVWRDTLPTFHDLSSLPEPVEAPSPQPGATRTPCKELQVWRPIGIGYGRDQSRFFPPRSRSTSEGLGAERGRGVTVRLPPPVACRLHRSDNSVDSSSSTTPVSKPSIPQEILAAFAEIKCTTPLAARTSERNQNSVLTQTENEKFGPVQSTLPGPTDDTLDKTAITTPQNVLQTSQTSVTASSNSNTFPTTKGQVMSEDELRRHPSILYMPDYNSEQPPYELNARETEVPYVHANSLVGYSNNRDVPDVLPDYEERQSLADSGVGLPILIASETHDMVGLNELVVDHDVMAPASVIVAAGVALPISLPATPPATPPVHPFSNMAAILPVECITEAEYTHSDAHYCSEQALFSSPLSLSQSAETLHEGINANSINIADFLKLGHAKQCWCGYCTNDGYDAAQMGANASISSSTTLADRDRAADGDGDLTVSLLLHTSESEPDIESDDPELLVFDETNLDCAKYDHANVETVEDEDWLLFSPAATKPAGEQISSASTMYLPSSPILHRQRQNRARTPTVVITSSEPSSNEPSDDYIAVAAPTAAAANPTTTSMAWHDMFPRRSSSLWKTEATAREGERFGWGFAETSRRSLRWGRESEEEWWDWAVEEEC